MTTPTRKKNTRLRGSHTHGGGSKKKRRGAGHRGGRGKAGTGKRADQNKPSYWQKRYFSSKGFASRKTKPAFVTIADIENRFPKLLAQGTIQEQDGLFTVDFGTAPCKLLSTGTPTRKYRLVLFAASKKAQEKIKKAGGVIETTKKEKKPVPKKESPPKTDAA